MTSYISAIFEKTRITALNLVRVIVQNRDDGEVPPAPNPNHFPTMPDDLRNFIVGKYLNDVLGEEFSRIATLQDTVDIPIRELDTFRDNMGSTFVSSGVTPGMLLHVTVSNPSVWTSDEYPETNPFIFQIKAISNESTCQLTRPFPAFERLLTWSIPTVNLQGTNGVTLRNGEPGANAYFRDTRFNRLFDSVTAAENAVVAMKADIQALANEDATGDLITETVTIISNV